MVTIALDEAGVFETKFHGNMKDSSTTLIGGVFFDDMDSDNEYVNELQRIEAFYRASVEEARKKNPEMKISYPQSLHSKGNNDDVVREVKTVVGETLPEFLQKGTFRGDVLKTQDDEIIAERQGSYRICAIVKSAMGKAGLLRPELGNVFKDGAASNLYYHMVSETVERLIFHNPLYPQIGALNLDIATRKSAFLDSETAEQYDELQHSEVEREDLKDGMRQFDLMNADVFRTILTEQMLNEDKKNICVKSFQVRPIRYYPERKNKPDTHNQQFLYLADTICSELTFRIGKDDINEVQMRATKLTGEENLIFSYDEVDVYFKRALQALEAGEYYGALKELYCINCMSSNEAKLYQEHWNTFVCNHIKENTKNAVAGGRMPYALVEAIKELRDSYRSNALNPDEATYILTVLKDVAEVIENKERFPEIFYYLNDCAVVSNCHEGNLAAAKPFFEACEELAGAVAFEEYIRTRNRYTTVLLDGFEYEEAISVIKVTLQLLGGLYDVSKNVLGTERRPQLGQIELAKTLSLAGQIASFLKSDEAKGFFDKALRLLEDNRDNYKITESYKLHYLIDSEDKASYLEEMKHYCDDSESLQDQMNQIIEMGRNQSVNMSFALYLFLKGLYKFYFNEEIATIWDSVKSLEEEVECNRKNTHPWELIYKYLGLLAFRMEDEALAKEYCKRIVSCVETNEESLVTAIAMYGEAELIETMGNGALAGSRYTSVYNMLAEHFEAFNSDHMPTGKSKEKKEYMQKKFSYMYS
jgi:tetratricopeptide (TPR) repeat protein